MLVREGQRDPPDQFLGTWRHTLMFQDIGQVTKGLGEQQYISTDEISTVMFLADKLEKPVLTEGPAGVGKTELAKAWAKANRRPLIRLQCYEGLDEAKAL